MAVLVVGIELLFPITSKSARNGDEEGCGCQTFKAKIYPKKALYKNMLTVKNMIWSNTYSLPIVALAF